MKALTKVHTQDLNDILTSARMMFCEVKTSIQVDMFRSMFGGLFCEDGASFGDKISAYENNKASVPSTLGLIAVELDFRAA